MKNIIIILIAATFFSCGSSGPSAEELQIKNKQLTNGTIQKNKALNEYRQYVSRVESSVKRLLAKENQLISELPNADDPSRDRVVNELKLIESLLDHQRYELSLYSETVTSQQLDIGTLRVNIEQLEDAINIKQESIKELLNEISDKDIMYSVVCSENEDLNGMLNATENELFKAYFAFGTFDEMESQQVAMKKGGILGIGAVKSLNPEFNKQYFTEIDVRQTSAIPIKSHKVELLTSHPEGSYKFVGTDRVDSLIILDKEEFWKLSKHLAIIVDN